MPAHALLEVTHYETDVYLGWTDEERTTSQKIALDITLRYPKLPEACVSDELGDTQCYAQLLEWAEAVCQSGSFKLIEHLAYRLYTTLKQHMNQPMTRISVRVHKLDPPVASLKCASFLVSDE